MTTSRIHRALALVSALGCGMLAAGCGGTSVASYCEDLCNTCGCPSTYVESCKATYEEKQAKAEKAGCSREFDDTLSCLAGSTFGCSDNRPRVEGCSEQWAALDHCEM